MRRPAGSGPRGAPAVVEIRRRRARSGPYWLRALATWAALPFLACAFQGSPDQERPTVGASPSPAFGPQVPGDSVAGLWVPDPFRAITDTASRETRAWLMAEDARAREQLGQAPAGPTIAERVRQLVGVSTFSVPRRGGSRLFYLEVVGGTDERVIRTVGPEGEGTIAYPKPQGDRLTLANFAPSPDGERLLYEMASDVSEERVLAVATTNGLTRLLVAIPGASASEAPWLPDGARFVFSRRGAGGPDTLYLGYADGRTPEVLLAADHPSTRLRGRVSEDGAWVIIEVAGEGAGVRVLSLVQQSSGLIAIGPPESSSLWFAGTHGGRLIFRTNYEAPQGRVVAVDARRPEPDQWQEVVGARSSVTLDAAFVYGGRLLLSYLEGPTPYLEILSLEGRERRRVEVPIGLIWTDHLPGWPGFSGSATDRFAYLRSLNLAAPGIYRLDLETGELTPFRLRGVGGDPAAFHAEVLEYASSDGTRVPIFVIRARAAEPRPGPTLMMVYGAFGWTPLPFFNAKYLTFLENGGTFAIPFVRGGGVYGEAWHAAGRGRNKVNTAEDVVAAGRFLIKRGIATPNTLALEGQGPGGMVAGTAALVAPELWGAVLLDAPIAEPITAQLRSGRPSAEYGDFRNPEDVAAMLAFSPYHRVRRGDAYPPILIRTGERDRAVSPLNAYRLAAALRAADPAGPTFLRIGWADGHGLLSDSEVRAADWAADLTFLSLHLAGGLAWPAPRSAAAGPHF